jgi:hypothetical protein
VEGGLRWLVGAPIDFSFARDLCACAYGARGGHCDAPASLFFLEGAAHGDGYPDSASFCGDLEQADKGRRYRDLAGRDQAIPGQESCTNFRKRVGHSVVDHTTAIMVPLCRDFGLIKGEVVSTEGQREPTHARCKGCAYACQDCQGGPIAPASRQELAEHLHSGSQRLESICPVPEVVAKVRKATAKTGPPRAPKVALREGDALPPHQPSSTSPPQLAQRLDVPPDPRPPVRLTWAHLRLGPSGELRASCPTGPSDLEAGVGDHVDTKNPGKKERVFGSLHLRTTDLHQDFALAFPLGNATYAANADEGTECIGHREALARPVLPGQVQLADAANDALANYRWVHDRGGMAIVDDNRRHAHLDPESLVTRGSDEHGTPYAPWDRLCPSNGYDDQARSRQDVCGRQCPAQEHQHCPHRYGVLGSSHRRAFNDHPRLIGPIQRGTPAWQRLSAMRWASERTNSSDQEVIAKGSALKMRGRAPCRFAGAIRTLGQLLRRACDFVLDAT